MTLRALWYGCWIRHGETIWTHEVMECLRCGTVIAVLPQPTVRGPAAIPEPVRGQPLSKAKVERRDNIERLDEWRRSER